MALYHEEPVRGRETDSVCEDLGAGRFRIDGRELSLPLFIPDCVAVANAFLVPIRTAAALVEGSGLTLRAALPGYTPLVLLGVQYRDNPLGRYGEGAVLFTVHTPGEHPTPLGSLLELVTARAPLLVYRMPVTEEFTTHGGRYLWGYPKYLADASVTVDDGAARARLEQDGRFVFSLSAKAPSGRRLADTTGTTLTVRHGVVRTVLGRFGGDGFSWSLGGVAPEIGDAHPLALELRSLGLPKHPFASAVIRRAHLEFPAPRVHAPSARASSDTR